MATRTTPPIPTDETVWLAAFTAAEIPLFFAPDSRVMAPMGAAHLCAEFADAALVEFRNRFQSKS